MDQEGPVSLEHEQTDRFRQPGRQATCVGDLAAGDDETHRADRTVCFGRAVQFAYARAAAFEVQI